MKASPYLIEQVKKLTETALQALASTFDLLKLEKSKDAEEEYKLYKENILKILEQLRSISGKYPKDVEVSELYQKINDFYQTLSEFNPANLEKERKSVKDIDYQLGQIVHWRKLEAASARVLPFKDYRRGEKERRGAR